MSTRPDPRSLGWGLDRVFNWFARRANHLLPRTPWCPAHREKIFRSARRANQRYYFAPSRAHKRGASRSSRTLGAGSGGRYMPERRARLTRTAKSCGP